MNREKSEYLAEQLILFREAHEDKLGKNHLRRINGFIDDVENQEEYGLEDADISKAWSLVSAFSKDFGEEGLNLTNPSLPSAKGRFGGSSRNPYVISVMRDAQNAIVSALMDLVKTHPIIADVEVKSVNGAKQTRTIEDRAQMYANTIGTRLEEVLEGKHAVLQMVNGEETYEDGNLMVMQIETTDSSEEETQEE
jgi:hypothetical protein|tara:strand:+ start:2841 stop:3425 length:585 start_codon:yes stop_codon:yes gene_type:complete